MIGFFYLAFGFALLALLQRGERRRPAREIFEFSLALSLAFALLLAFDFLFTTYLWGPTGLGDLRLPSLFLWAFLVDQARERWIRKTKEKGEARLFLSRFFLTSSGFTLWVLEAQKTHPAAGVYLWGWALIPAAALVEWLLDGLRERLRLSWVPRPFEGIPILLILAAILFLALWGAI